jgi:AcrR family transcriptional regulator
VASPHRDAAPAVPLGTKHELAKMTAETSRVAGGRARLPSAPSGRAAGERPPAQRLLTAAEELFGERSYHRTTVADICGRAGMATGSFYSYYTSKAEIFAAVVRAINADLRQAMKAALEHAGRDQRSRERASFRAYFDLLSKRPWIDRIVRESEFIDPGLFREYYEHLARGYARGVRAAQMARDIDARYDPEVIAYAYTGIGNFVGMRWAEWTAGGRVPEDVLDDVLELLARGLAPKTQENAGTQENAQTEDSPPAGA